MVTPVIVKVLEQSISSLYKSGEGVPLEEALEAYRSRLQEKEAILVNEQQVPETLQCIEKSKSRRLSRCGRT